MDIAELKEKYTALKTKANAAWAAAKPERDAYEMALVEFHSINEEIDLLLDGQELVGTCEGCQAPIFDDERSFSTVDGVDLCAACSPMASDGLRQMKDALAEDDWPLFEFESRDDMVAAILQIEQAIAANGDYSLAT